MATKTKKTATKKTATKKTATKKTATKKSATKKTASKKTASSPKLLSGGNPQIAMGDGEAPVQAYLDAMPGWKSAAGRQLDALITRAIPSVKKAVKWNSPFYAVDGKGFVVSFHCFNKYIKVTFLNGQALSPLPPVPSKDPKARYVHIFEDEHVDEALLLSWFKQAAANPGWQIG